LETKLGKGLIPWINFLGLIGTRFFHSRKLGKDGFGSQKKKGLLTELFRSPWFGLRFWNYTPGFQTRLF